MRIPSGVTDQYIYFVAVDSTDFTSREIGLSSFTVYVSRNGAAAAQDATPTINETDTTNMPGVYEYLVTEDMTIAAGNDSEEVVVHITHAGMAPVTRTVELYRPKITAGYTLGVASDGDISGNVDGNVADVANLSNLPTIPANWITSAGINDGAITAGKLATAAITAAKFGAGAIDAAALATDAVAEIADGVWDEDLAGHVGADAAGLVLNEWQEAGRLDAILDIIAADTTTDIPALINALTDVTAAQVNAEVDTALADFFTSPATLVDLIWDEDIVLAHTTADTAGDRLEAAGGAADPWGTALPGAYGAGTAGNIIGNNLDAVLSAVETDTQNIQSRLPAALVGGAMDADVSALQANVITAAAINAAALTAAKFGANSIDAAALATDAAQEIRNAVTGGAYALDTDANGAVRVVDGTGARELSLASGVVAADTVQINSVVAAAVNAALMYDGTGYNDATAPASRSQVDGIGAASGAALNYEATSDNLTVAIKTVDNVGTPTGTYANTQAEDGSVISIAHATNDIDHIFGYTIGGARTATEVTFAGYLTGGNDAMLIQAYDFVGSDWETIAQLPGQAGTANVTITASLLSKHTGTGADLGNVYIRFEADGAMSSPTLVIDKLLVAAVNIGQSVGYAGGTIWVDTTNGTAGTEAFVNGVADNPVDTWADALTLAAALSMYRFHIVPGSAIQLTANSDAYEILGVGAYTLDLNGQSIAGAVIKGATVSGTGTGADAVFTDGLFGTCTLAAISAARMGLTATLTMSAAATYLLDSCYSAIAGSASPTIDFGAAVANSALNMRHYSGGITIANKDAAGTDTMSLEGDGQLVVSASSGGAISLRGNFRVTNTGGATITYDDSTADWLDGGRLDLILDIIAADTTTDIPALIAALPTDADVLTQINAALDTSISELGVAQPTATPTLRTGLMLLYMALRNKRDTTSSSDEIHNNAGTVICSNTLSDDTVTYISSVYVAP